MKNKIKETIFKQLTLKNSLLENTKDVHFEELKTSNYLLENGSTSLSKIIFSIRSRTFDIKTWLPWKYSDNLCVVCEFKSETMDNFLHAVHMKTLRGSITGKPY